MLTPPLSLGSKQGKTKLPKNFLIPVVPPPRTMSKNKSFFHGFRKSFIVYKNIFKILLFSNCYSQGPGILRLCLLPLCVTFHMSCVDCHMSTHVSYVTPTPKLVKLRSGNFDSMFTTHCVSHVTFHVSSVMCHM